VPQESARWHEVVDFIEAVAMQHCLTCRAVFMPARTGMPFCSTECARLDPRPHRFETARRETERAAALRPPPLWE
jgi:hypothetical protein